MSRETSSRKNTKGKIHNGTGGASVERNPNKPLSLIPTAIEVKNAATARAPVIQIFAVAAPPRYISRPVIRVTNFSKGTIPSILRARIKKNSVHIKPINLSVNSPSIGLARSSLRNTQAASTRLYAPVGIIFLVRTIRGITMSSSSIEKVIINMWLVNATDQRPMEKLNRVSSVTGDSGSNSAKTKFHSRLFTQKAQN